MELVVTRRRGEHPETAQSLNNLGVAHFDTSNYTNAEELYKRSAEIKEGALGGEHPELALTLNNLAELYRTQRRFEEAEPLYARALAIDEKSLGPDHPARYVRFGAGPTAPAKHIAARGE